MPDCIAHPGVVADRHCSVCGKDYCQTCFSGSSSQVCRFCEERNAAQMISRNAKNAFVLSIIGFFCCGVVLSPIAFFIALNAKKEIRANPALQGEGKATAALWISVIGFLVNATGIVIGFFLMFSGADIGL